MNEQRTAALREGENQHDQFQEESLREASEQGHEEGPTMSADETSSGTNGTTSGPWVARNWPVVVGVAGALLCATAIIWLIGSSQSEELGAQGALVESEQAEHPEREAIEQTVQSFLQLEDSLHSGPLPSNWSESLRDLATGDAFRMERDFIRQTKRQGITYSGRTGIQAIQIASDSSAGAVRVSVCVDPSSTQQFVHGRATPRDNYEPRVVEFGVAREGDQWKLERIYAMNRENYTRC